MKTIRILSIFALIALLIVPVSSALAQDTGTPAPAAAPATPAPAAPPKPLAGQATWLQNCAPCHGTTGKGDGPSAAQLNVKPTALGDYNTVAGKTLQDLFTTAKNGRMDKMMPPWGQSASNPNGLTDQQIWDVIGYAWSLHSTRDEITQGKAVYEANCASCHGADGKSAQGGVDLSDFAKTSQVPQAAWADAVAKGKGTMPAFAGKLSDADQKAALAYARQLSMSGPLFREPLTKGTGVISGTVTNKTINKPAAALTVTLGIFDQVTQLEQRTAKTDANGFYKFDQLPTDSTLAYAVRTEYPANVPYTSQFLSFTPEQTAFDAPINVYETTTDGSGIAADQVHYIVEFDSGRALIAELIVLSLAGDKTYVGDGNHVLAFPLPEGATELNVSDGTLGDRYIQSNNGFVDREPLPPGQGSRQILFRYALPYNGTSLDLVRTLPYAAKAVNALISDAGEKVTSPDLTDNGRRDTQQGGYFNFSATDWPANKQVRLSLTNLPTGSGVTTTGTAAAATGVGGMNKMLIFGLIALAAGIAAVIVALPIIRNRANPRASAAVAAMDRDELIDALAQLDQSYEAGEIGESAYRDERLRLKAQLRDMMRGERAA